MTCNPDHKYYLGGKQVPKTAYEVWEAVCRQLADASERIDSAKALLENAFAAGDGGLDFEDTCSAVLAILTRKEAAP